MPRRVPFVGDDSVGATYATASMLTFTAMTTNLFQYGIGVAEDRAQPWDPFTRTLPAGPGPRFAGRILAGLVLDQGLIMQHAATTAREYGIPAVIGTGNATRRIRDGAWVTVDGVAGTVEVEEATGDQAAAGTGG